MSDERARRNMTAEELKAAMKPGYVLLKGPGGWIRNVLISSLEKPVQPTTTDQKPKSP